MCICAIQPEKKQGNDSIDPYQKWAMRFAKGLHPCYIHVARLGSPSKWHQTVGSPRGCFVPR